MEDIRTLVCRRIRELRLKSGLTQEKFAHMTGLSPDAIAQFDRAGATPTLETICKITQGMGMSIHEFFKGIGEKSPSREKEKALRDIITYLKGKSAAEIRKVHKMATLSLES